MGAAKLLLEAIQLQIMYIVENYQYSKNVLIYLAKYMYVINISHVRVCCSLFMQQRSRSDCVHAVRPAHTHTHKRAHTHTHTHTHTPSLRFSQHTCTHR